MRTSQKPPDSSHGWRVVPNLARGLQLTDIDQLWVVDITYVNLAEEFAYLAIVLDGYSRKVIGWAMATADRVGKCSISAVARVNSSTPPRRQGDQGQYTIRSLVE
ncbi:DDE-type integrase/transposase/recombinase [Mesorhizobium sp. M0768]|uniref:DDE-type integrase/transposase/recombinase n=1 Tax=Mesorhizobium sp. M0768 TaxID=2956996 RepID=UPI003339E0BE